MRFVAPDTVRLSLSDGHWIEVKQELTAGEKQRYRTAGLRRMSARKDADGESANEVDVDWVALANARVNVYLVDWSARDAKDKPMPLTPAAISNLDQASFEEIDAAIQAHIEAMDSEKKVTSGSASSTAE